MCLVLHPAGYFRAAAIAFHHHRPRHAPIRPAVSCGGWRALPDGPNTFMWRRLLRITTAPHPVCQCQHMLQHTGAVHGAHCWCRLCWSGGIQPCAILHPGFHIALALLGRQPVGWQLLVGSWAAVLWHAALQHSRDPYAAGT